MLFRRRNRETGWDRVRVWLWPRVSWRRSWTYAFRRALRLSATPHAVALGCAVGAFVGCTPLLGFHFALTFVLAWILGGNLIAGALGTFVANPLTFPVLMIASHQIGRLILSGEGRSPPLRLDEDLLEKSLHQFWPTMVGSIPVGLMVGAIVYVVVNRAVAAAQAARRRRLQTRGIAPARRADTGEAGKVREAGI